MRVLVVAVLASLLCIVTGCDAFDQPAPSLVIPSSGPCAGIPEIPRDNPPDNLVLTPDPALEAMFPRLIDGQPVNDLASARWIETLCMLGGEASVNAAGAGLPPGMDLTNMSVASAGVSVDGPTVTISAFRLPGHNGRELIPAIASLSLAMTGEARFDGQLTETIAGGKDVLTWTNASDGSTSYLYPTDDTLFVVSGVTTSQANKVFAALP